MDGNSEKVTDGARYGVKATSEQAKAIRAQKGVVVRSAEGRMAPQSSQRSISEMMIAKVEQTNDSSEIAACAPEATYCPHGLVQSWTGVAEPGEALPPIDFCGLCAAIARPVQRRLPPSYMPQVYFDGAWHDALTGRVDLAEAQRVTAVTASLRTRIVVRGVAVRP